MGPPAVVQGAARKPPEAFNIVVQMLSQTGCGFYDDKRI